MYVYVRMYIYKYIIGVRQSQAGLHIIQYRYKHAQKKNITVKMSYRQLIMCQSKASKRIFKFIRICKDKWKLLSKSEQVSNSRVTQVVQAVVSVTGKLMEKSLAQFMASLVKTGQPKNGAGITVFLYFTKNDKQQASVKYLQFLF